MNIHNTKTLTGLAALAAAPAALAQDAQTVDQQVNAAFANLTGPFVNLIFAPIPGTGFPWIVMWLVIAASVFTLYFGFIQFRAFMLSIDSAVVMHNASTQFSDGGEFGMGAEIGIATGRLHARGPVGATQLTSFKYVVRGNGQIRS